MRQRLADLFSGSLVVYLILFLLENIFTGIVSTVFNLNYLLIPVLVFGILSSLFPQPEVSDNLRTDKLKSDVLTSVFLSLLGGGLVYYKIDLDFPLRQIIALVSTLLILTMSLLVVLPPDFKFPKFKYKYLLLLLLVPVIFLFPKSKPNSTITRLPPEKYQISLINRSGQPKLTTAYQKLLIDNGYTNIVLPPTDNFQSTDQTSVLFSAEDQVAGQEITDLLKLSYGTVLTVPLQNQPLHTLVIILK